MSNLVSLVFRLTEMFKQTDKVKSNAIHTKQKHIYFVDFATPLYASYIHFKLATCIISKQNEKWMIAWIDNVINGK